MRDKTAFLEFFMQVVGEAPRYVASDDDMDKRLAVLEQSVARLRRASKSRRKSMTVPKVMYGAGARLDKRD